MESSDARSEMSANQTQANSKPVIQPRPPRNSRPPEQRNTVERTELQKPQPDVQQKQSSSADEQSSSDSATPKRLSLAELFAEDDEGNIHESDVSLDPNDSNASLDSVEGVLKRLGLKDPKEFYSIKVPMPNGAEPLTIGELKDRVGELVDLETRELQFDERRRSGESEMLRAQQEMREIMALLPKNQLSPELVEKIRRRHEATQMKERELTLQHIPDWQNETRRMDDIKGMIQMLSDYGFDDSFITTVVDHRALKFIRDAHLTQKRIRAALAKVTVPQKKGGQKPSGKTGKAPAKVNVSESTRRTGAIPDQRSRLASLFNTSE